MDPIVMIQGAFIIEMLTAPFTQVRSSLRSILLVTAHVILQCTRFRIALLADGALVFQFHINGGDSVITRLVQGQISRVGKLFLAYHARDSVRSDVQLFMFVICDHVVKTFTAISAAIEILPQMDRVDVFGDGWLPIGDVFAYGTRVLIAVSVIE